MRVIDADSLCSTTIITDDYSGNEILEIVLKEDIDEAPTIEAIPIPKDATNGDMLRAMFPKYYQGILSYLDNSKWWNTPYKKEVQE